MTIDDRTRPLAILGGTFDPVHAGHIHAARAARDALGTNRRTAQALLERLDRDGVTTRRGDERVLA